jgi:endonuclease YncB( thermonuclease family)
VPGIATVALLLTPLALPASAQTPPAPPCTLQAGETRAVVRVLDAETVRLDDDREVRLIGALAPRSPDMRPDARPWPPELAAEAALRALVLGRSVEIAYAEPRHDRYGRLLAHLFVEREGERLWVQGELLANGHARAYGLPGSFQCIAELRAHEQVARDEGKGLWGNAAYATRRAFRTREILQQRNSYQIVAGRVAIVATTKTRTYLNFGRDWRSDFTAGIATGLVRDHPQFAQKLATLEGKAIEVRGWIEYRNGPYIEVEDPSQIAIVEAGQPSSSLQPGGPSLSSQRPAPSPKRKRPATRPGAVDV